MSSIILPEPVCSELFRLLLRSASLLAVLAEEWGPHTARKLDFLISQGWTGRLEFSFDSVGPLPSVLTMESPKGEAVEVFRLEPTSLVPSFQFANSRPRCNPLDNASNVARALLKAASASIESSGVKVDTLLSDGSVCTLSFLFGNAGALSCGLLLKGAAQQAATELVRFEAPLGVKLQ